MQPHFSYMVSITLVTLTSNVCGKSKKTDDLKQKPVSEWFPGNRPEYNTLTRLQNEEDRAQLYSSLQKYGKFTGLCWLMSPEPQVQEKLPAPFCRRTFDVLGISSYRHYQKSA